MTILVIDDHAKPRQEARRALEQICTQEVVEFADAREALTYYTTHPDVDLIVTDIVLPGMTGIELAEKALEHRVVPVVLHTGSWARDALYRLVLNGSCDTLPLEIANKAYFFKTWEEYTTNLQKKVSEAQTKAATTATTDTTPLRDITRRLKIKDTLVDYVKTVYDELFTQLERAITVVAEQTISAERKAKILNEKPDLTQQTTDLFLHNLRYPLQMLNVLLAGYTDRPEVAHAVSIVEKMRFIKDYVETEATKFSPSMMDIIVHKRELQGQPKKMLPMNDPPPKLANRVKMLKAAGTPYIILEPEEEYETPADDLFTKTGEVIIRSMSMVEDNTLPFAGYFDSKVVNSPEGVRKAIQHVRTHYSKDLETFSEIRGYELPTVKDMTILIEPYIKTEYVGAVVEHPTRENVVVIEFMPRSDDKNKQAILYDKISGTLLINETNLTSIEANHLAQAVAEQLEFTKAIVGTAAAMTYQMEIGFSLKQQERAVYAFQLRTFKRKQPPEHFIITNPLPARTVFGTTTDAGIECIVATTTDPIELDLIGQRARAEGLQIAYITKDDKPNVPFCTDIDVLITGKDLMVQAHAYFNPLSQAPHAVLLTQAQLAELNLEPGRKIRYISNGSHASITTIDTTESVKYEIRNILNQ